MTSNIVEMTSEGKPLTVRAKKAIEYFNQGDYERCKSILDDEERRKEWERDDEREEEFNNDIRERREGRLNEIRIKIDTIKAQGITTQTEGEILELYEEATEKIFKHGLEIELAVDYVDFLWVQKHFSKGIKIGEYVYERLKRDMDTESYLYRGVLGLLGLLYSKTGRYEEAEAMYRKALEILEELSEENRSTYIGRVAGSCNNLGLLYDKTGRYEEAESLLREALEIYRELITENRSAYLRNIAIICYDLRKLYEKMGNYEEAEAMLKEGLNAYEILSSQNDSNCSSYSDESYNVIGHLKKRLNRVKAFLQERVVMKKM